VPSFELGIDDAVNPVSFIPAKRQSETGCGRSSNTLKLSATGKRSFDTPPERAAGQSPSKHPKRAFKVTQLTHKLMRPPLLRAEKDCRDGG
jgi:hypothetical protein